MASGQLPESRSRQANVWKRTWCKVQTLAHLTKGSAKQDFAKYTKSTIVHENHKTASNSDPGAVKGTPSGRLLKEATRFSPHASSSNLDHQQNGHNDIPGGDSNDNGPLSQQSTLSTGKVSQQETQNASNNTTVASNSTTFAIPSSRVSDPPDALGSEHNDHNSNTGLVSSGNDHLHQRNTIFPIEVPQQDPQQDLGLPVLPRHILRRVWSEQHLLDEPTSNRQVRFSIQAQIPCELVTFLREEQRQMTFPIIWLHHDSYGQVKDASRSCLYHLLESVHPDVTARAYRVSAEAELLMDSASGPPRTMGRVNVKHIDAWAQNIPTLIARHGAENPFVPLRLRSIWTFDWYELNMKDKGSLTEKIRLVMIKKYEINYRNERFLPRAALEAILTNENIRELIIQDDSLKDKFGASETCEDRTAFVAKVANFGIEMLASCITGKLPLSRLHGLICRAHQEDRHLPIEEVPSLDDGTDWFPDFHDFRERQKIFRVYDFDKDMLKKKMQNGFYEVIEESFTIPILGPRKVLGQGSFGIVYEVSIHQDHHNFDKDIFALKQLYTPTEGVSTAFKKEHDVFSNIMKVDHPAILIPLAMWRAKSPGGPSRDEFCMLYPIAEQNLAEYLREHRQLPKLSKDFVLHLMRQLLTLAEGLDAIHRLGPSSLTDPGEDEASTSLRPPARADQQKSSVCHRDLRPENILIFQDGWKISDFGTARITQIVSGKSYKAMLDSEAGDPEYGPPDRALGRPSGRKYDVWSFGCIIFEILLTLFEEGTDDQLHGLRGDAVHRLDAFCQERLYFPTSEVGHVARYWYKNKSTGEIDLRPPVRGRLEMLRRITPNYDQFDELVKLVSIMLNIKAEDRPSAAAVLGFLKTIDLQVRANLSVGHEDFYERKGSRRIPFASQPITEIGSQRDVAHDSTDAAVRDLQTRDNGSLHESPERPSGRQRTSSTSSHDSRHSFDREDTGHLVVHSGRALDVSTMTPVIHITSSDDEEI